MERLQIIESKFYFEIDLLQNLELIEKNQDQLKRLTNIDYLTKYYIKELNSIKD